MANQELVDQSAQGPEVDRRVLRAALEDLGRPVVGRAAGRPQGRLRLHLRAPAEVADPDLVLAREQHVLGLEVAVNYSPLVAVLERGQQLAHDRRRTALAHGRRTRDLLEQLVPVDILEHEVDALVVLKGVDELAYARVLERLHGIDLPERKAPCGRALLRQRLDRDARAASLGPRQTHRGGAAGTQHLLAEVVSGSAARQWREAARAAAAGRTRACKVTLCRALREIAADLLRRRRRWHAPAGHRGGGQTKH
mmetsp:Transcript_20511/g.64482  ORF Transcript_20511/g.64482 Transcript_20511/m.64482 type:complete len:253 (+) Transcript_20511:217-975(+)